MLRHQKLDNIQNFGLIYIKTKPKPFCTLISTCKQNPKYLAYLLEPFPVVSKNSLSCDVFCFPGFKSLAEYLEYLNYFHLHIHVINMSKF